MRYTIGSLPSGSLQNAQAPVGKSRESCIGPRKGDECFIPAGNDEPCAGIIFRLRSFLELFDLRLLEIIKVILGATIFLLRELFERALQQAKPDS